MIVVLQGGLCNQLFQYAFGRSVSLARGEEVLFTRDRVDADSKRSYSLGAFNVNVKFAPAPIEPIYGEPIFQYDPGVYTAPTNSTFIGHWQTEKYFNEEVVRKELTFRDRPSAKTQQIAEDILQAGKRSAFLHIRRTD